MTARTMLLSDEGIEKSSETYGMDDARQAQKRHGLTDLATAMYWEAASDGCRYGQKEARALYEAERNRLLDEIELWREYVALLVESEKLTITMFHVHGGRFPEEMIERGKRLRSALGIEIPLPEKHEEKGRDHE